MAYRGGAGGHGPRAQALEGAPAQLVGANFNGANAMGPELSRAPISLGVFFLLKTFLSFFSFFFFLAIFPPGADAGFMGGGGERPIQALAPGRWRPSGRHCTDTRRNTVTERDTRAQRHRERDNERVERESQR